MVATAAIVGSEAKKATPQIVSGSAAPRLTPSGAEERWWSNDLTLVIDGSVDSAGPGAHDAVVAAFGTWISSDARLPRLTFDSESKSSSGPSQDGQNRVYFAPIDVPGHESDLGLTIGYSDSTTGQLLEADVILNKRMAFSVLTPPAGVSDDDTADDDSSDDIGQTTQSVSKTKNGKGSKGNWCNAKYDFQSVASHEAGHFFGLGEDMTDSDATMYFSTQLCDLEKRTLTPVDTNAMEGLYASAPPSDATANGAASCTLVATRLAEKRNGGALELMALALCVAWSRRARPRSQS